MRIPSLSLPMAALAACLAACSEPGPDLPRLEFQSDMPKELTVGDTTEALAVTRYWASETGRENSEEYYAFRFESADTSVIQVVQGRRLLGLKPGTSAITAEAENGSARTPSPLTVSVK